MYRCQVCGCVAPPRTPRHQVVVKSRVVRYQPRPRVNRVARLDDTGKHKVWFTDDPGGAGTETLVEVTICPTCAAACRDVKT